jgi:glycopeptide antibiotics resistance protein
MDALLSIPVAYRWIATLAFIGVIIALSVTPGVERPDITSTPVRLAISFVLSLCLGVALEWYQTTVPGRFGTITDVILNTIGTISGLILAVLLL